VNYLGDPRESIRSLARQWLGTFERAAYAERLKMGDHLAPEASDAQARLMG
jgi:hypothetical protein